MNNSSSPSPGLGNLVKEYKLSATRVRQIILVMCISAGMSSVCLLPAIFETNESITTRVGITILGLFVALPFFVGIYQLFRLGGVSLSLYENGLIHRQRGKEFITAWDEIESFTQENACRIAKTDGEILEFGSSIEGVDEVADVIQNETLKCLLPNARQEIENGVSVQFKTLKPFGQGPVSRAMNNFAYASSGFAVNSQGITDLASGKRIAWVEVRKFGIEQVRMGRFPVDVFTIRSDQAGFQTRLGLLSNAHVLLALCAELTGLNPVDDD
jgi:hypothetical protein